MLKKDYKNYDYINVSVKKSRAQALTDMYAAFSWEETSREEHRLYDDVFNLSFRRPHAMANKDELQFLQVCAESEFNSIDMLENHKHASSASIGGIFGLAGCALFACGIAVVCLFQTIMYLISGCLLAASGVALGALTAATARTLFKGEEARCIEQCAKHRQNIRDICAQVKLLTERGK